MIRVTGLYRNMSNSEFDFDYYVEELFADVPN